MQPNLSTTVSQWYAINLQSSLSNHMRFSVNKARGGLRSTRLLCTHNQKNQFSTFLSVAILADSAEEEEEEGKVCIARLTRLNRRFLHFLQLKKYCSTPTAVIRGWSQQRFQYVACLGLASHHKACKEGTRCPPRGKEPYRQCVK